METVLYIQNNVFSVIILLLIYSNIHRRAGRYLRDQQLFILLIVSNGLALILDTAMWVLDGRPGLFLWAAYSAISSLYYFFQPLFCLSWLAYVDYQIFRDQHHLRKEWSLLLLPIAVNAVLAVLSINQGYLFYVDGNNIYHRGEYFLLAPMICYFYLIGSTVLLVSNRKRLPKNDFFVMLVASVPPLIGGIVQTLFYGVSLIWIGMALSLLIIFIQIQNDQLFTDHLTGLSNRRQLDYYLRQHILSEPGENLLVGLMIDLDSFKKINDVYGHPAGDHALEHTAKLLCKTFRQNDFIARYGGDEFIVIMEIKNVGDIESMITRFKENVGSFNAQKIVPYNIDFSVGWDFLDRKSENAIQRFLQSIDERMYKDKQRKASATLQMISGVQ